MTHWQNPQLGTGPCGTTARTYSPSPAANRPPSTPISPPSTTSTAATPRPGHRQTRGPTQRRTPRALSKKAQLRWLRAAEQASPRDRAIALAGFYAGLRIAEIVALDLTDLRISARKGHLIVRYGKGGHYREVPLHPVLHKALDVWLTARKDQPAGANPAVFLNRRGERLSTRWAYNALAAIAVGRDAEFTPHVLRHTAGTTMTRAGTDIIIVAEILGHSVETARRYALPTHEGRHAAIGRCCATSRRGRGRTIRH